MDGLSWDGLPVSLWSNQQHEIEESFMLSNSNGCGFGHGGGKISHFDDFLNHLEFVNLNSEKVNQMVEQLAPTLNSINVVSNLNLSRRQEPIEFAKLGVGINWGKALNADLCSSPSVSRPYTMKPLSGLMAGVSTTTSSLESIDCLISGTNCYTDTSVEDDGISMLFSDYKNLWDFGSVCDFSSGNSVNSNSSDAYIINDVRSSETRPTKRSNYQSHPKDGGFKLISKNPPKRKKPRSENHPISSNINFQQPRLSVASVEEPDSEAIAHMKQMIYQAALFRPVNLGVEAMERPKRKNVKISSNAQTAAARQRRERISEKIRVLQRLVPGGSKMDTASMLDGAANYLKFLRSQVKTLETLV